MSRDSTRKRDRSSRSVIPDEGNWRPSRTSVVLGGLIAVGSVAVLIGTRGSAAAAVAALAGFAAGGVLLFVTAPRHRLLKRLCASVLFFVCGLLLLGCVGLAVRSVRSDVLAMQGSAALLRQPHTIGTLLLVGGVAIASGGASVTGRDSIGAREFKSTINFGLVVVSLPLVALGVLATIEVAGLVFDLKQLAVTTGDILFGRTGGGRIDYLGLGVTWTVTLISITSVKVGLKHLPIAELAEASRRERLTTRLDRVQSLLDKLRLLMFAAPFCVFLIELVRMTTSIGLTDAYLRILSPIGTASALRGVLFAGILLGVVSAVFVETMKRIAQLEPQRTIRRSIPFVSGLVLAVVLVQFSSELVTLAVSGPLAEYRSTVELFSSRYSEATLVVVMLVVAGVTPAGLYSVLLVIDYALLPEFADGAALLSAGLFVAAVGGLLSGPSPIVGFIGIAGSFIVWDLNTNAVSLGRELGRHTPTRQAELVHAGGSLLVATLGTVVAMGGLYLANAISAPPEGIAPVTAVISVVGLLALIVGLRGR